MMLPLIQLDDTERDERFDGVSLVSFGEDWKITSEDFGGYFQIREWEINGTTDPRWFCRSGYSLDKEIVEKLSKIHEAKIRKTLEQVFIDAQSQNVLCEWWTPIELALGHNVKLRGDQQRIENDE